MCETKQDVKNKLERLIDSLDRHSNLLERVLGGDQLQDRFKLDAGSLHRAAS